MIFDFDLQKSYAQSIEVEDIGNFGLRCTNKAFEDFYICAQTCMGKTYILKFGPIMTDVNELTEDFTLEYKKIDYKEKAINLEINKFINDGRRGINQAEVVSVEEVLQAIPTYDKFIPA